MILILIIGFLTSFFVCYNIIYLHRREIIIHKEIKAIQNVHEKPTPRIGGISIYLGLIVSSVLALFYGYKDLFMFVFVSMPAFLGGIIEDFTKSVSPHKRLALITLSGILAFLMGIKITKSGIFLLDILFHINIISFIVTIIALDGITNAMNIIDGFNGLASGVSIMIIGVFSFVAFQLGDLDILFLGLMYISVLLGFFLWNFPKGEIFLGDGGAYLTGFFVGFMGIALVNKHSSISPFFPLSACIYPIYEIGFSIYRRKIREVSPYLADSMHFHTLIYKILTRKLGLKTKLERNNATSIILWMINFIIVVSSFIFKDKTYMLIGICIVFGIFYNIVYFWLLKLKL